MPGDKKNCSDALLIISCVWYYRILPVDSTNCLESESESEVAH